MPTIEDDAHYTVHVPGCPNNGIHGVVTCALCHDIMNKPTPAAPALSTRPQRPQQPTPLLPSRSNVWQRSYKPPTATPSPRLASTIDHSGSRNNVQVGNIVYQALQRPKLLRGGEWQLSVANNLMAAGLGTMTIVTWNWRLLIAAAFFAWPVQWLIRMVGRHDPLWWQIYFRMRKRPLIREPHGYSSDRPAPTPRILPKLRKFVA